MGAVPVNLMTVTRSAEGSQQEIFQLVGRLADFFGALFVAREGASIIYDSFLKTEVTSFLNRNLQGGQAAEIISQLQAGLDQLPQVLGNVLDMALDVDAITQAVSQGTSSLASVLEEAVIGPAVLGFVSVLLFTVCFALLGGLVRLLTSAIHLSALLPHSAAISRFLGGVIGNTAGVSDLYLVCILLRLVFYLFGGMRYCNQQIIMDTFILSKFYTFDPLSLFA